MRVVATHALMLLLLFGSACSCFESADPRPTEDVVTLVNLSVEQWLFLQVTEDSWPLISAEDAGWRSASNFEDLYSWFSNELAPTLEEEGLWDFSLIVQDIKESELYLEESLSDDVMLGLIKSAISSFTFVPDEGK